MDKESYVYVDSIGTWRRSFWVNKEGAFLTKSIWKPISSSDIKTDEANGFLILYKNFEKFNQTKLPKAIEIKSLDEKVRLKLRFLERNINSSIPDRKFQIRIPEDAKPVEIDKAASDEQAGCLFHHDNFLVAEGFSLPFSYFKIVLPFQGRK
jgi:hypothetical protein